MENPQNTSTCILCEGKEIIHYYSDNRRDYLQCTACQLVFVPENQRLTPAEELKRYDLHQNNPEDEGYRKFLSRIYIPMNDLISPGSYGLDFGSGPGPILSLMFTEGGHKMEIYDHFYAKDRSVFKKKYDFITTTEVIEHLFNPGKELEILWSCLNSGGYLGIMTKLVKSKERFEKWFYKDDETHVAFYSKFTFEWLAKKLSASLKFWGDDVMIFRKR